MPPGWCTRPGARSHLAGALVIGLGLTANPCAAGKVKPPVATRAVAPTNAPAQSTRPAPREQVTDRPIRLISESKSDQPPADYDDEQYLPDNRGTSIDLSSALRLAGVENLELVI